MKNHLIFPKKLFIGLLGCCWSCAGPSMEWISVQDLPPHDKVESHSLKLIHEVAGFYTGRVDIDYSPWSFLQEDEEVKIWINHSWDDSNQKAIFRVEKSDDVLKYICTIFTFTGKKTDVSGR